MGLIQSLFGSGRDPEYGRESVTLTGVKVKSYAEKQIADYFTRNGIEYQYERVARSQRLFSVKKIARPDFYLPAFKVFVEYWGLVDADSNRTRSEYTGLMRYKMAQYHRHKIRFVSLYPSDLGRLDQAFRRKLLETTGKELPVPG